jgi:hypothetical protein
MDSNPCASSELSEQANAGLEGLMRQFGIDEDEWNRVRSKFRRYVNPGDLNWS